MILADDLRASIRRFHHRLTGWLQRGRLPIAPLTIVLACLIGVAAGYGAVLFTWLIHLVSRSSVQAAFAESQLHWSYGLLLCALPALGLLVVSWMTRRFAPEAQGHGVPEVIAAVARHDGVIRPRVSVVKILASGLCIGTGGSVGREGPIVQIGSALGSLTGQFFQLSAGYMKVLVAAGAAAGISATFNAPLAGVMFASEIILGSFAVESLTPIVIASVIADVVHARASAEGWRPAFAELQYEYLGAWEELPSHLVLGLLCGLAAVSFTKLLYFSEDVVDRRLPVWWQRALILGTTVGVIAVGYELALPKIAPIPDRQVAAPVLMGVGYQAIDRSLRLENEHRPPAQGGAAPSRTAPSNGGESVRTVVVDAGRMRNELVWLLPLIVLKPLLTSLTLAGGGSGGVFAPSLFLGAALGGSFGLVCNLMIPSISADPGVYAIVGMGAVVAGTTHGLLSAILIVYEMTGNYNIILPIMAAAGLASVVARVIDSESIYHKKLSRRGESIARGLDMHHLEHIRVRDVMVRDFPTVFHADDMKQIIRVARANPQIESLPVMGDDGTLVGIIRPQDLHRVLDSDISPALLNADDVVLRSPLAVSPDANLLEAMRDFGSRDVETLPVESGRGESRQLVGLLLRADVMRRYRQEMLRRR